MMTEVVELLVDRLANRVLSETVDPNSIRANRIDVVDDGRGLGTVVLGIANSDGRDGEANGRGAVGSISSLVNLSRLRLLSISLCLLDGLGLRALLLELGQECANLLAERGLWRTLVVSFKLVWVIANPRVVERSLSAVGTKLVVGRDRGCYQSGLLLREGPVSRRNCGRIAGSFGNNVVDDGDLKVVDVAVRIKLLALTSGLLEDAPELVVRPDQDPTHVPAGKDLTPLESAVEAQALRVVLRKLLVPADQTVKLDHVGFAALVETQHSAEPGVFLVPLGRVVLKVKSKLAKEVVVLPVKLVILLALEGRKLEEGVLLRIEEWDVRTG